MGFRFKKSISVGKFGRINISKSGIGYSVGTKGLRFTKTATEKNRTTASIPGTGISYVTESSSKKPKKYVYKNSKSSNNNEQNIENKVNTNLPNNPNNDKKYFQLLIGAGVIVGLSLIVGLFGNDPKIEEITIDGSDVTLDINQEAKFPYDFYPSSSNEEILFSDCDGYEISLDENSKNIIVKTLNEEKNCELKLSSSEANSNIINLTIVDSVKKAEEEKIAAEKAEQERIEAERLATEKAEQERLEAERLAAEKAEQERIAAEKAEQERIAAEQAAQQAAAQSQQSSNEQYTEPANNGVRVYIPQSGSKYHSNPSCSNMKNPTEVSIDEAISWGYTPCKKCY